MGKVFGSCGDEIRRNKKTGFWGFYLVIWDFDREGEKCQTHMLVCAKCKKLYEKELRLIVPEKQIWK